ncbi:MAG: hypothetical protein R3A12_12725 [Ignavibacteria bacterium]
MEIWTTYKGSRETFYSAFENRLEFEVGLTNKLQTAFYLNTKNVTKANSTIGNYDTEFEFKGSLQNGNTSYLINIRTGSVLLYIELGLNTDEIKLEAKLITDKQISKISDCIQCSR